MVWVLADGTLTDAKWVTTTRWFSSQKYETSIVSTLCNVSLVASSIFNNLTKKMFPGLSNLICCQYKN